MGGSASIRWSHAESWRSGSARPYDFELQQDSVSLVGNAAVDLMSPVRASVIQLFAEGIQAGVIADGLAILRSEILLSNGSSGAPASSAQQGAQPDRASPPPFLFRRSGDFWELNFESGGLFHLRDLRGVSDIAQVLSTPRKEVSAWELSGVTLAGDIRTVSTEDDLRVDDGRGVEVADKDSINVVRSALEGVGEQIAAATDRGALEEVQELREFEGQYQRFLNSATDRRGRPRLTAGASDKARVAVKNRITRAIEAIKKSSPAMAQHLDRSIRTGTMVVYQPETNIPWEF